MISTSILTFTLTLLLTGIVSGRVICIGIAMVIAILTIILTSMIQVTMSRSHSHRIIWIHIYENDVIAINVMDIAMVIVMRDLQRLS